MEPFLSFVLAHAGVFGAVGGSALATLLHSRLAGRNLLARSLSLALPGFLNTPLAKALAVDVAKAVLAAWDHPAPPQTTNGVIDFRPFPPPPALPENIRVGLGLPARDPSGNPVEPTPGS